MFRGVAGIGLLVGLSVAGCTSGGGATPTTTTTSLAATSSTSIVSTTTTPATTTSQAPEESIPDIEQLRIVLAEVFTGFDLPVLLVADPLGGADYVVEQSGRVVRADGANNAVALDIADRVEAAGERGLLGLAFHPDFAANGLAYINYTDSRGRTTIDEFVVTSGQFDVKTRRPILRIDQPAGNHNGGMIAFGPRGWLWIGMGDGGGANDQFRNGQDPHSLLGSMLRISVPGTDGRPYDIPDLNPYVDGVDGAPEVYAYGVRNPWRFSFDFFEDGKNADIWIADVGQDRIEEVNVIPTSARAANYGWPILEGSDCFAVENCDPSGTIQPIVEYTHDDGCSITGGYVYRGQAIPELEGHYFYGDFCSGFLRSYSPESGEWDWTEMTGPTSQLSAFGIGSDGELYVLSRAGSIYRIERAG